jgi:DnaK suppressor protein
MARPQTPGIELPPDEYLTKKEVLKLWEIVQDRIDTLMANGRDAVTNLTEDRDQEADAIDVASSESEREFVLRLADRERLMLRKLKKAQERMEEGEYGMCDACGEPITFKRLMVRPVATQCIDCKTQAEQLERRSRAF